MMYELGAWTILILRIFTLFGAVMVGISGIWTDNMLWVIEGIFLLMLSRS